MLWSPLTQKPLFPQETIGIRSDDMYYLMITNIPTSTRTRIKVCAQANGVQRAPCTQDKNEAQLAGPKKPLKQIDLWKLHQPQQRRKQ